MAEYDQPINILVVKSKSTQKQCTYVAQKTSLVPIVTESAHVIVENWQQAAETRRRKSLHVIISALHRTNRLLTINKQLISYFELLSYINLIRVAYVVRRPCSDFTDMLRRHINCRIIIIIILLMSD